jgi:hypothetical protein
MTVKLRTNASLVKQIRSFKSNLFTTYPSMEALFSDYPDSALEIGLATNLTLELLAKDFERQEEKTAFEIRAELAEYDGSDE